MKEELKEEDLREEEDAFKIPANVSIRQHTSAYGGDERAGLERGGGRVKIAVRYTICLVLCSYIMMLEH